MHILNILSFTFFCSIAFANPSTNDLTFLKTSGSTLFFTQSEKELTLKTGIPEVQFIDFQYSPKKVPYALFSGRACARCDATQLALYLMRIDGKGQAFQFVYPGKITDPKSGATVYQGRSFYGKCLPQMEQGLVTHQSEKIDRRKYLQSSVLQAKPGDDIVEEKLIERRLPSLRTILRFVKAKTCKEIKGYTRKVLRKPLDLTPHEGLDDEETDLNDLKSNPHALENDPKDPTKVLMESETPDEKDTESESKAEKN